MCTYFCWLPSLRAISWVEYLPTVGIPGRNLRHPLQRSVDCPSWAEALDQPDVPCIFLIDTIKFLGFLVSPSSTIAASLHTANPTMAINLVAAAAIAVLCLSLYLYKLNKAMSSVPVEARVWRPRPWTDEEIRETYERVCKEPIDFKKHLPPKLERRYIIVGGSGQSAGIVSFYVTAPKWHSLTRSFQVLSAVISSCNYWHGDNRPHPSGLWTSARPPGPTC